MPVLETLESPPRRHGLSQLDLRRAPRVVDHVREDALEIE
jgi:hypothetical protein